MEPQKTQNCQSKPEEQKQSRRHNTQRYETKPQSDSNKDRVGLEQKTDIQISGIE